MAIAGTVGAAGVAARVVVMVCIVAMVVGGIIGAIAARSASKEPRNEIRTSTPHHQPKRAEEYEDYKIGFHFFSVDWMVL
jgi:uncharacterized membrane-anchored protein YhcB (DUF1043 family)